MLCSTRPRRRTANGLTLTLLLSAMGWAATPSRGADTVLIPQGSDWSYLDDGSDQGSAWSQTSFDDSAWTEGPAQLGYGDGDEATTVSFGADPANKFTTTYFRHDFVVADPSSALSLTLRLLRDDGAVVYLNGIEILRSNMPGGSISAATFASAAVGGSTESAFFETQVDPGLLQTGQNLIAAEVHQANATSSDISFDLELLASDTARVTRGPYLQTGTPNEVTVRWRTDTPTSSRVDYGVVEGAPDLSADDPTLTTEHVVRLNALSADTTYHYSVGSLEETLAGGAGYFFVTSPAIGGARPTRIWALGDSGTANANAAAVRDAYAAFTDARHTDLWLMLGDNAYNDGTDAEYQAAVFDLYPTMLRKSVLWPTLGNHDGHSADSATESGPYYDIFTLPRQAEAGGVASGTEAYYSFDYGNVHFICLDSYDSDLSPGGAMLTWLQDDLVATTADWAIAFWHHPPYSKGSHDSDTESRLATVRQNILPILEDNGVDLVLSGHSHSYERSFLADGHYGDSLSLQPQMILDQGDGRVSGDGAYTKATLGPAPHEGAVYVVAGSSGKESGGSLDHPLMFLSVSALGSLVLDIDGTTLDARFLDETGATLDSFTIAKGPICGNGVREGDEECDGGDLGGASCQDEGCSAGNVSCTSACTLDTSGCSACGGCDFDGICESGEDCNTCASDCVSGGGGATCGNGICEAGDGEDCLSCPQDCRGKQNGKPSGRFCCGDGDGETPLSCSDPICISSGFACTNQPAAGYCCGDATCSGAEDSSSCELDCGPAPFCGDAVCDAAESSCTCAADCGAPPIAELSCTNGTDDDCDGQIDCADGDCSTDPACSASCEPVGALCANDSACCSNKCRGPSGRKTCK